MRKTNVKTGHWAKGFTGRGSEPPPPLARRYTFSVLQAQAAPVLIPDILLWLNNCTNDTHQTSEASLCHEDWGPEGEAQIFSHLLNLNIRGLGPFLHFPRPLNIGGSSILMGEVRGVRTPHWHVRMRQNILFWGR